LNLICNLTLREQFKLANHYCGIIIWMHNHILHVITL
jgi:hypothetical protein